MISIKRMLFLLLMPINFDINGFPAAALFQRTIGALFSRLT
jgi:hypothetical protein